MNERREINDFLELKVFLSGIKSTLQSNGFLNSISSIDSGEKKIRAIIIAISHIH